MVVAPKAHSKARADPALRPDAGSGDDIGDIAVASMRAEVLEMNADTTSLASCERRRAEMGKLWFTPASWSMNPRRQKRASLPNRGGARGSVRDDAKTIEYFDKPGGDEPIGMPSIWKTLSGQKDWDKVVVALKRQQFGNENAAAALEKAVKIQINRLDDKEQAAETYGILLELDENHPAALGFLSEHRYQAGDSAGAVELYERREAQAESWDLDDFDVQIEASLFYYHYALSLIQLERVGDAKARLNKALDLNPSHLPSLQAVGPLYMEAGEWKKAEQVYRNLLKYTGIQRALARPCTTWDH